MNLKQSLFGNNYNALRTLPNFNKIQEELEQLETQMFHCADKSKEGIYVNTGDETHYHSGIDCIKLYNLNNHILNIFCSKHNLSKKQFTPSVYYISWFD